ELLCNWWVPACWETAGMGCSHTFAEELTTAAPIALQCSAGQAESKGRNGYAILNGRFFNRSVLNAKRSLNYKLLRKYFQNKTPERSDHFFPALCTPEQAT
ncbi:MAG: hypothetical protein JJT78_05300, partial [Leptospira sp.]|nr:hypothetical protein [Leptospira sp.]